MATQTPESSAGAEPAKKKSNLTPILIVVGVIVVIVIAAGAYLLTKGDSSSDQASGPPPPRLAKNIYAAWQAQDRAEAAKAATPSAVTAIFAIPASEGTGLEFGGCEKVGNAPTPKECTYSRPGGALVITVSVVNGARKVTAVRLGPAATTPTTTG